MRAAIILAAGLIAACASAATADGITISKAVAEDFEVYLKSITGTGSGVYAVTEDGQGGASAGCASGNCQSRAGPMAIEKCEALNPGQTCIIFARNRDPVMAYTVAP